MDEVKTKVDFEKYDFQKKLEREFSLGNIERDDLINIHIWKKEVEKNGIDNITPNWNTTRETDERWLGFESSLITMRNEIVKRIIFERTKDREEITIVEVFDIDTNHYKR